LSKGIGNETRKIGKIRFTDDVCFDSMATPWVVLPNGTATSVPGLSDLSEK